MSTDKKKTDLFVIILFILIGIGLFGYTGYVAYKSITDTPTKTKELRSLELYGYKLRRKN